MLKEKKTRTSRIRTKKSQFLFCFSWNWNFRVNRDEKLNELKNAGVSVEVTEPRGAGSRDDIKASAFIVQVHSMYSDVRYVQAVWEPRVFGAQCSGEESNGQEKYAVVAVIEIERFVIEAFEDKRRDNDNSPAGEISIEQKFSR